MKKKSLNFGNLNLNKDRIINLRDASKIRGGGTEIYYVDTEPDAWGITCNGDGCFRTGTVHGGIPGAGWVNGGAASFGCGAQRYVQTKFRLSDQVTIREGQGGAPMEEQLFDSGVFSLLPAFC